MEYRGEVFVLREGDWVELFSGINLAAMETPGHNPSCLCFAVDNCLFTGDSYIPGVKVVTNLPGSKKKLAQESVEKILRLGVGKKICPGHAIE